MHLSTLRKLNRYNFFSANHTVLVPCFFSTIDDVFEHEECIFEFGYEMDRKRQKKILKLILDYLKSF